MGYRAVLPSNIMRVMTMTIEHGLRVPMVGTPQDTGAYAKLVEENGFDFMWVPDTPLLAGLWRDVYMHLTCAALETSKIRLGPGVTNPITRHPVAVGSAIVTLDEVERKLDEDVMVIADAEKPLVVAGVMGSLDAEVDDSTVDGVIEAAWFAPGNIRATSRKLGLSTDSSHRFTRDVDPQCTRYAARRAIDLILESAGGELVNEEVKVGEPSRDDRSIEIQERLNDLQNQIFKGNEKMDQYKMDYYAFKKKGINFKKTRGKNK